MNYMGIDHHRQYSHITLLDEKGEKLKSGRVSNLRSELENFLSGIEEVKAIAKAKIKTDKRDSWMLAHLLRTDLIPEVYKRSRENRSYQRILRQRAFYVGSITRVKNRIHALLSQQSEDVQEQISRVKNLFGTKGMKVLRGLSLPGNQKELREARLIHTVPGFGVFLSVITAVEIADIGRFENVRKFHSYAGVIPSTHSSGERTYHGRIVKEGNRWLRWAAVEAVWPAIRADFDLRCYYERLKRKKGANSAKMATARRLLTIIYRMLKENRPYIPYKR